MRADMQMAANLAGPGLKHLSRKLSEGPPIW